VKFGVRYDAQHNVYTSVTATEKATLKSLKDKVSGEVTAMFGLQLASLQTLDKLLAEVRALSVLKEEFHAIAAERANKLALRAVIDAGRKELWKLAKAGREPLRRASTMLRIVAPYNPSFRSGQTIQSWGLQLKALNTLYPQWLDALKIDPAIFALLTDTETLYKYGPDLCDAAHKFTKPEMLTAASNADVLADMAGKDPAYVATYNFAFQGQQVSSSVEVGHQQCFALLPFTPLPSKAWQ
jgi:hypothetical protein